MSSASICKGCGAMILWARRSDDPNRWHRPLEATSAGSGIAVIDDVAVFTNIYLPHVCKAEFEERTAEAKQEQVEQYEGYRDRDRSRRATEYRMKENGSEVSNRIAAAVDCPRCKVEAGEFCVNIPKAAKGIREYVKWPHLPRFMEGENLLDDQDDSDA